MKKENKYFTSLDGLYILPFVQVLGLRKLKNETYIAYYISQFSNSINVSSQEVTIYLKWLNN